MPCVAKVIVCISMLSEEYNYFLIFQSPYIVKFLMKIKMIVHKAHICRDYYMLNLCCERLWGAVICLVTLKEIGMLMIHPRKLAALVWVPSPQMSYLKFCRRQKFGYDVLSCFKAFWDQELLHPLMTLQIKSHLLAFVTGWLWMNGTAWLYILAKSARWIL